LQLQGYARTSGAIACKPAEALRNVQRQEMERADLSGAPQSGTANVLIGVPPEKGDVAMTVGVPSARTVAMIDENATEFSHVKPDDTDYRSDGLRDFFLYRDLGIAKATHGKVIAHLVKANLPPEHGTGWHKHIAEFQIVIMMKGWARFMYEGKETLVEAGDCVHQRPGITHYLFDYSPDMEYLEIVGPADFGTVEVQGPCEVPPVTPWT
jgi:quercetin dioxygenase-like cupin family protein